MEQDIKVSVICNAFNHEKYIRDTFEGFISQKTDFAFEVLVHDDASTDGTADIIREYEEKYPEIIKPIYQTENQFSQGVKISPTFHVPRLKGEYVTFCEGDDYWTDPLKLQKQYDFLKNNPEYTMCVCSTAWLNMITGQVENKCQISEDIDIPIEDIILEKRGRIFQLASIMIKADVWKQYPEWRLASPIGDLPIAILGGLYGKVRMLADTMTVYRWYSQGSWTARMDSDEHRAKVSRRMIHMLGLLDEATNGKYTATISLRIKRHKYTLALMEHDFNALMSDELKDMYMSRSALFRISDRLRCKHPKLYTKMMKPLAKLLKAKLD